jgi:hypothetical protein
MTSAAIVASSPVETKGGPLELGHVEMMEASEEASQSTIKKTTAAELDSLKEPALGTTVVGRCKCDHGPMGFLGPTCAWCRTPCTGCQRRPRFDRGCCQLCRLRACARCGKENDLMVILRPEAHVWLQSTMAMRSGQWYCTPLNAHGCAF